MIILNEEQILLEISKKEKILFYGTKIQKKISSNIDEMVKIIQSAETKEVEAFLEELISLLKTINFQQVSIRENILINIPILGIYFHPLYRLNKQFENIMPQIENISKHLERIQYKLFRNSVIIDGKEKKNKEDRAEIELYIEKGKEVLEDLKVTSEDFELIELIEKRVYDLIVSKTISLQMEAQSLQVAQTNRMLATKIQETLGNTIPLFKSHFINITQKFSNASNVKEINKIAKVELHELKIKQRNLVNNLDELMNAEIKVRHTKEKAEKEIKK